MRRWIFFILTLLIGAAAGLYYGWVINPVEYVETTPDTLRSDYKTDYVLMVAESYRQDGDLELAARRLAVLGETPPGEIVGEAVVFAAQARYAEADLALMQKLSNDLKTANPSVGAPKP